MCHPSRVLLAASLTCAVAAGASAQCALTWRPSYGCPGVGGTVFATVSWDPDGAGPQPPQIVVGGDFYVAGTVTAHGLAMWNPATGTWSALPAAPLPVVTALAVSASNELVVASQTLVPQLSLSQVVTARIATWNGTAWSGLGADFDRDVRTLLVRPGGQLVAAGAFTGGSGIVAWNGSAWAPLGGGIPGPVLALATMPGGDLIAGGAFATAGTVAASNVARWNGTAWSPMAAGSPTSVWSLAPTPLGGAFAGNATGLLRWSGGAWSAVPGLAPPLGYNGTITGLAFRTSSRLVVGGEIATAGGQYASCVAEYDVLAASWSPMGAGIGFLGEYYQTERPWLAMQPLPGGGILVGGALTDADALSVGALARWNGTAWSALSEGPPRYVAAAAAIDDTQFAIGGSFRSCGNVPAASVAQWNGAAWMPMGPGLTFGVVCAMARLPDGDVVAGGSFQTSGAATVRSLARWHGGAWSEFGGFTTSNPNPTNPARIWSILVLPNAELVVGGSFAFVGSLPATNVARWDGTSWTALGAGLPGVVTALSRAADGALVALSDFRTVSRWNGSSWVAVFSYPPLEAATSLATMANGTIVLAATTVPAFTANYHGFLDILPNGAAPLTRLTLGQSTSISGLTPLPDGSVLATGNFTTIGALAAPGVARLRPDLMIVPGSAGAGAGLASTFAGGDLLFPVDGSATGAPLHAVARLGTTCPAAAVASGAGCTGSGGPNVLAASALAWLGATFRASATGMPANGLALEVLGLTTGTVPLVSLVPQGAIGCDLLVSPDLLLAHVPVGGIVVTQLAIPSSPALVGRAFHQQVVPLELSGAGGIVALTSTNRLSVTIGEF